MDSIISWTNYRQSSKFTLIFFFFGKRHLVGGTSHRIVWICIFEFPIVVWNMATAYIYAYACASTFLALSQTHFCYLLCITCVCLLLCLSALSASRWECVTFPVFQLSNYTREKPRNIIRNPATRLHHYIVSQVAYKSFAFLLQRSRNRVEERKRW